MVSEHSPEETAKNADAVADANAKAEFVVDAEPKAEPRPATTTPRRRRITSIAFLVIGLLVALYLATQGAQDQHLRIVLGAAAPQVVEVGLQYVSTDGEVAREAHFAYPKGSAPRVVAHDPRLPNGDYRLEIDVDALGSMSVDGLPTRVHLQRQVTLGGGSTQIDISSAISRDDSKREPP